MIRIIYVKEPEEFDAKVRARGSAFLSQNSNPKGADWDNKEYWRDAIGWLREAYDEVCAYFCHWIPLDVGASSVDHFVCRDSEPALAYEWINFRLASSRANSRKGTASVLDPFTIQDGWFVLEFPSLLVAANKTLPLSTQNAVKDTIKVLKLNDEHTCVRARLRWIEQYIEHIDSKPFLQKHAPFIYKELERQNLLEDIRTMMAK